MGTKSTRTITRNEAEEYIVEFLHKASNETVEHALEILNDDFENNFINYLGHYNFRIVGD